MSKYEIQPQFEYQNMIFNVKIRYLAQFRMSKYDLECQNTTFGLSLNMKNRTLNVKIQYSIPFRM